VRQHAGGTERLGPRHAAGDVVLEERAIETERDAEVEGRGIGGRLERPDQSVVTSAPFNQ
jgi:hypothetical protein